MLNVNFIYALNLVRASNTVTADACGDCTTADPPTEISNGK